MWACLYYLIIEKKLLLVVVVVTKNWTSSWKMLSLAEGWRLQRLCIDFRVITTITFEMVHRPAPSFIHLASFLAAPGIVGLYSW